MLNLPSEERRDTEQHIRSDEMLHYFSRSTSVSSRISPRTPSGQVWAGPDISLKMQRL